MDGAEPYGPMPQSRAEYQAWVESGGSAMVEAELAALLPAVQRLVRLAERGMLTAPDLAMQLRLLVCDHS